MELTIYATDSDTSGLLAYLHDGVRRIVTTVEERLPRCAFDVIRGHHSLAGVREHVRTAGVESNRLDDAELDDAVLFKRAT